MMLLLLACIQDSPGPEALPATPTNAQEALDAHNLEEASRLFELELADHRTPGALAGLGWTKLLLNEREQSKKLFDECHQVAPKDPECLRGQAALVFGVGNLKLAEKLLSDAEQLAPDDLKVKSSRALLLTKKKEYDAAAALYVECANKDPTEAGYQMGLGEVLLRQERYEEARTVAEGASKLTGVPTRTRGMIDILRARITYAVTKEGLADACAGVTPEMRTATANANALLDKWLNDRVRLPELALIRNHGAQLVDQIDNCEQDKTAHGSE